MNKKAITTLVAVSITSTLLLTGCTADNIPVKSSTKSSSSKETNKPANITPEQQKEAVALVVESFFNQLTVIDVSKANALTQKLAAAAKAGSDNIDLTLTEGTPLVPSVNLIDLRNLTPNEHAQIVLGLLYLTSLADANEKPLIIEAPQDAVILTTDTQATIDSSKLIGTRDGKTVSSNEVYTVTLNYVDGKWLVDGKKLLALFFGK